MGVNVTKRIPVLGVAAIRRAAENCGAWLRSPNPEWQVARPGAGFLRNFVLAATCGSQAPMIPSWTPSTSAPRKLSRGPRSEEHTSELQSLMRISYAVFCLKKKKKNIQPKISSTFAEYTHHNKIPSRHKKR